MTDTEKTTTAPRGRPSGRPTTQERRKVADDILAAAKRCLQNKGVSEVSLRDIAAEAGTNEAMINYYYGSRNNLLLEVVDEAISEFLDGLLNMRADIIAQPDKATYMVFDYLENFCSSRIPAAKILISELIRTDSKVKSFYISRWSSATSRAITETIKALMDAGLYRKDVDPKHIAFLVKGIFIYPLLTPTESEDSFLLGDMSREDWVGLVAQIMDFFLRAGK